MATPFVRTAFTNRNNLSQNKSYCEKCLARKKYAISQLLFGVKGGIETVVCANRGWMFLEAVRNNTVQLDDGATLEGLGYYWTLDHYEYCVDSGFYRCSLNTSDNTLLCTNETILTWMPISALWRKYKRLGGSFICTEEYKELLLQRALDIGAIITVQSFVSLALSKDHTWYRFTVQRSV
jgi:hypothetical protein